MGQHLITPNEAKTLGRPITGKLEEDKLNAFITEVEQMNIKPVLGDKLFIDILEKGEENEVYKMLLNGGSYTDSNNNISSFTGLKSTIAYFVYAQNLMSGDLNVTRYGTVFKDDDYSSRISSKERSDAYNNTLEVANYYLKECVKFCKVKGLIQSSKKGVVNSGGMTIRKIG